MNALTDPTLPKRRVTEGRLATWRRAARAVLWAEYLARAAWPALSILAGAIGVALLGLVPTGAWIPLVFLLACVAGVAASIVMTLRRVHPPAPEDAERRLERDSGLRHRPFMVLRDRPAALSGEAGLWALHHARAESVC